MTLARQKKQEQLTLNPSLKNRGTCFFFHTQNAILCYENIPFLSAISVKPVRRLVGWIRACTELSEVCFFLKLATKAKKGTRLP